MKKYIYVLIILVISCSNNESYKCISIDVSQHGVDNIDINEENSFVNINIYHFKDIITINDSIAIVKSDNDDEYFKVLDFKNEKQINTFGKKGNGPDEFGDFYSIMITFYNNVTEEFYVIDPFLSENKIYTFDSKTYHFNLSNTISIRHPKQSMPLNGYAPITDRSGYFRFDDRTLDRYYLLSYYDSNSNDLSNYFHLNEIKNFEELNKSKYILECKINYTNKEIVYYSSHTNSYKLRFIPFEGKESSFTELTIYDTFIGDDEIAHVYDILIESDRYILLSNFEKSGLSRSYTKIIVLDKSHSIVNIYKTNKIISRIFYINNKYYILYVDEDFIGNDDFDFENEQYLIGSIKNI